MKIDWFEGPYHIRDRIGRVSANIKPGEILLRCNDDGKPNGILALRCPACLAVQFRAGFVEGSDSKPTIDRTLICGCKSMCGAEFQIKAGKAERVEQQENTKPTIPENLRNAGVKPPPKNNCL